MGIYDTDNATIEEQKDHTAWIASNKEGYKKAERLIKKYGKNNGCDNFEVRAGSRLVSNGLIDAE